MEKSGLHKRSKPLHVVLAFFLLLFVQELTGKAGNAVANLFTYRMFDPDDVFAWQSVHHIVLILIGLAAILVLRRPLNDRFGFQVGDKKKGMRYVVIFTAVLTVVSLAYHVYLYFSGQPLSYDFALNPRNVLGTLGFQLLLSGTAEEILYRALPITVLVYALGKSVKLKGSFTLEIVLTSLLFSLAHIKWSLSPFSVEASVSQLIYAFAIGTVQGMAYQESRSILYPVLMHSVSNVLMVGTGYLFAALI